MRSVGLRGGEEVDQRRLSGGRRGEDGGSAREERVACRRHVHVGCRVDFKEVSGGFGWVEPHFLKERDSVILVGVGDAKGDEMDEGRSGMGLNKGPDHGSAYMLGASRVGCWVRVGGLVVVMA